MGRNVEEAFFRLFSNIRTRGATEDYWRPVLDGPLSVDFNDYVANTNVVSLLDHMKSALISADANLWEQQQALTKLITDNTALRTAQMRERKCWLGVLVGIGAIVAYFSYRKRYHLQYDVKDSSMNKVITIECPHVKREDVTYWPTPNGVHVRIYRMSSPFMLPLLWEKKFEFIAAKGRFVVKEEETRFWHGCLELTLRHCDSTGRLTNLPPDVNASLLNDGVPAETSRRAATSSDNGTWNIVDAANAVASFD